MRMQQISRQAGFSLTELMVSLVLSLVLLAGAMSILYSSRLSYAENEKLARVQEAGRTVMEIVMRDVRAAGFNGCARPLQAGDFVNDITLVGDENLALFDFERPLGGYEGEGTSGSPNWSTSGGLPDFDAALWPSAGLNDVLIVRAAREGQPSFRTTAEITGTTVPVAFGIGGDIPANTPVLVADCRGATSFVATSFTVESAATATDPGIANITFTGPGAGGTLTRGFQPGATIVPIDAIVYYVGANGTGDGTSLWRKRGTDDAEELVEGIEGMQLLYGVDINADRIPNSYVPADEVGNWNNVVSVQVAFLIRSEQEYGNDADDRVFRLLDRDVGPFDDRRYRSVFTTTVALRNRAN